MTGPRLPWQPRPPSARGRSHSGFSHNPPRPPRSRLFPASIMAVSVGAAGHDRAEPSPSTAIRARRGSPVRGPCGRERGRPAEEARGRDGRGGAAGALRGSGCRARPRPARWRRCRRRGRGAGVGARRGAGRGVRQRKPFSGPLANRRGAGGASGGPCPVQLRLPPV